MVLATSASREEVALCSRTSVSRRSALKTDCRPIRAAMFVFRGDPALHPVRPARVPGQCRRRFFAGVEIQRLISNNAARGTRSWRHLADSVSVISHRLPSVRKLPQPDQPTDSSRQIVVVIFVVEQSESRSQLAHCSTTNNGTPAPSRGYGAG